METRTKRVLSTFILASLCMVSAPRISRATFPELAQRLPAETNAVVAVNVARLVKSPYGKQAGWGERLAESWEKQPMMIPPGAIRVLTSANVKPSSMESYWEMSLIEMDKLPALELLAKDEGGHVDKVWDRDVVVSPINAYFVPLENNVLASMTPAERTQVARWIRQPIKPEGSVTSPFIKDALAGLGDSTDVVMAMDLEGAYGVPNIRKWLNNNQLPQVPSAQVDKFADLLGTMKGIKLVVTVDDKINGKATVPFDRDAAPLNDAAKPIMLAILTYAGMRLDDIPQWTFSATGKEITMSGELSDASLRRLLSIVQSPVPAAAVAMQASAKIPEGGGAATADPAQASKRYYKMVSAVLDNIQSGRSPADTMAWIRSGSKRIDQLPILNVDPELVEWGAMVSTKLKMAAGTLAVGATQMQSRVAGVMDPEYAVSYTYDNVESSNRAAAANAARQRRQAALDQRAQTQEQALRIVTEIAESRPKIRADMVAKYQIEF